MEPEGASEPWCMRCAEDPAIPLMLLQDERRMARFAQYAMVASEEALNDAGWTPKKEDDLEATVCTRTAFVLAFCSR